MICTKCKKDKKETEFYKNDNYSSGYNVYCIQCQKDNSRRISRTEQGVIKSIYNGQLSSSKRRGHIMPLYSLEDLSTWLYENNFKIFYDIWVQSGYQKDLKPSVDRLNDFKGYSFDNIKLTTWCDNRNKQYDDFRKNKLPNGGYFGGGHKAVEAINEDGTVFKEFISMAEAKRYFGLATHANISMCCSNKKTKCAGYKWRYKK